MNKESIAFNDDKNWVKFIKVTRPTKTVWHQGVSKADITSTWGTEAGGFLRVGGQSCLHIQKPCLKQTNKPSPLQEQFNKAASGYCHTWSSTSIFTFTNRNIIKLKSDRTANSSASSTQNTFSAAFCDGFSFPLAMSIALILAATAAAASKAPEGAAVVAAPGLPPLLVTSPPGAAGGRKRSGAGAGWSHLLRRLQVGEGKYGA